MDTELKKTERNPILLIGIGIFSWIGIGSIAFLFQRFIKDIFLNVGVEPKYTEILSQFVDIGIYIIGIIVLINVIKSNKISEWKIFKFAILLLFIGQILQYFESAVNTKIKNDNYLNNSSEYYNFLNENPEYYSIGIVATFLIWIITALIIYLKKDNSG